MRATFRIIFACGWVVVGPAAALASSTETEQAFAAGFALPDFAAFSCNRLSASSMDRAMGSESFGTVAFSFLYLT